MSENAIEINNLTKTYKDFKLDNVTFSVPTGSVVGFIGENGAGKTTTIKSILGLIKPDNGTVLVNGKEIEFEKIGVVFDECCLPVNTNANQTGSYMKKIFNNWNEQLYSKYLKRFDLPLKKKIKDYSRGMKMKLSIAVALSHNAQILILDEATGGLDPVVRTEILDLFREFMEDEEHAILMSSHITSDIEKIADYVVIIHQGKIVLSANKDELLYQYGIVKCDENQVKTIPEKIKLGVISNPYGRSVLVNDKNQLSQSEFVIDKPTMEEILLFLVKEENKQCGV